MENLIHPGTGATIFLKGRPLRTLCASSNHAVLSVPTGWRYGHLAPR